MCIRDRSTQSVTFGSDTTVVQLLDQDRSGLTVKLVVGQIDFIPVSTAEGDFVLPRIDGFTRSFEIGEPTLPVSNNLLSIPFGCELRAEVVSYEAEEVSLTDLQIVDPLMPVQPPLSKSVDPASVPFEYKRTVYETPGYYSLPLVRTQVLGTMREVRLGELTIAPIAYSPTEGKLRVHTSITVHVTYEHADWAETERMQQRYFSPYFVPTRSSLLNYELPASSIRDDPVSYTHLRAHET